MNNYYRSEFMKLREFVKKPILIQNHYKVAIFIFYVLMELNYTWYK